MSTINFDRAFRRFVPSLGNLSYNSFVKIAGNALASLIALPFRELRDLPPNHLRLRVGVGNRVLRNHVHFLEMGRWLWLHVLSHQYCTFNSDVVELGCGCGRIARPLKDEWFEGSYVGVDVDKEMIEYCRNHFPDNRFQFLLSPHQSKTYSAKSGDQPGARDSTFSIGQANSKDFVYSLSLYSHLLENEFTEYLAESFRVLRPGGWMYLTFFCMEDVDLGQRWTFAHRRGNAFIENPNLPEAAVAYHKAHVIGLATSLGFQNVTITSRPVQSVLVARKQIAPRIVA
jgi:SAM-dependent methyltransferase